MYKYSKPIYTAAVRALGGVSGALKCLAVFGAFALCTSVSAQVAGGKKIDEQSLTINRITYKIEGPKTVAEEAVRAHVRLRKGMKFDQKSLDQSIRSLYQTGLYDAIDATRTASANGGMDIEFVIVPKYRVSQVVFKGNKEYSARRLQEEISSYAGSTLSEVEVKRDADKLKAFYQKKGYSLAKVKFSVERNDEQGKGAVIFDIDEGADIEIQNIRFTGDPNVEKEYGFFGRIGHYMFAKDNPAELNSLKLLKEMKTDTWIPIISHITDNGRFKEFQADIEKLRKVYRDHGYLDVEIDESKIKFEFPDADNPGDMDIVINIVPNRQYKVGKVSFKNNKLFKSEKLMPFVEYYDLTTGNVFSPSKVDEMIEKIRIYYGEYGYIDTIVRALRKPNVETGDIDLVIDIIESGKFYLESINIQGNSKTKSEVIRRNLRIVVKEGRTGNLTFGAGFSTIESLVATVEITQGNFDYENYKNYFQGAGQKFRIRGSIGLKSNQIIVSFEEPWVFNRNLAYGIDAYRTDTGYYSDYYSEVRLGASNYLRKRVYELIEARLAYKLELVDIYDVDKKLIEGPDPVMKTWRGDVGERSLSQMSLSFLRDSRDSLMTPTRGTRFEFIQDVAGGPFLGQTNLYRIEGRAGWWIPTFEMGNQVLSFVGRTGTVIGYGGKDVPYFEQYFLGGGYNMRGFKYRKVGRIDPITGEAYGGKTFAFASAEYSIELFNPVRFAVFYDIGFVNTGEWDWDPSDYNSDFGVGFRILLMGAPMRIDLGFPWKTGPYNDDGMQFNFSFGTVF